MGLIQRLGNLFSRENINKYNNAFFRFIGTSGSSYDIKATTYIKDGFNINPIVYSVISQMATKTSSIPFYVKKIEDKNAKIKLRNLTKSTKFDLSARQQIERKLLTKQAYTDEFYDLPYARPNPLQTWNEFLELYKTFIKLTGNVYLYKLMPKEGLNAGRPIAIYLLPSHLMNIVLKRDANLLSLESPVAGYKLIEGDVSITFGEDEVTHIKYPNPNFDFNGSHLYGLAPTQSILKNIESSNEALNLNIKTMKNGGAFGFIHSKGNTPLREEQANSIKDRLIEMDSSTDKLAKIAGVSAEIGFTRLSMTNDELKLFDYLNFDQKQICNAFGWSDKLMNNDAGAKYDNVNEYRKQVVVDNIIPNLELLREAFNTDILPFVKGYQDKELIFDYSELPEMQSDLTATMTIVNNAIDRGYINRLEARDYMSLPKIEDAVMSEFTVANDIMTLEQSLDDFPNVLPNDSTI